MLAIHRGSTLPQSIYESMVVSFGVVFLILGERYIQEVCYGFVFIFFYYQYFLAVFSCVPQPLLSCLTLVLK